MHDDSPTIDSTLLDLPDTERQRFGAENCLSDPYGLPLPR